MRRKLYLLSAPMVLAVALSAAADWPDDFAVTGPKYNAKGLWERDGKLLFVKRQTYHSSHFYTDFIDGCSRFGGNLCVLDLKSGAVTELVPEMAEGIFGRFDLHFSAGKVVFDWKKAPKEAFRIYEVDIGPDTGARIGAPRQLTFRPDDEDARIAKYDNSRNGNTARMYYHQTDDMHPCYLPDGGIAFTSSRCEYGTLCDAPDHLATAVIHRMDGDGKNMKQLTRSPVSEFSPSMLSDGRIIYTRWEYVDKGQLGVKCLWAMRPDGSGSSEVYGNDITFPPTFLHGREIPGENNMYVFLGTPHYPQSGIGTVIRIDMDKDIRTREPMTYITPYVDIQQEEGWN
ncbi:TolB family protein [Candidatus Sumerlaeota bacterium]